MSSIKEQKKPFFECALKYLYTGILTVIKSVLIFICNISHKKLQTNYLSIDSQVRIEYAEELR